MPAQTDGDCATGAREEAAHRSSPGRREQDPGEMPDVPVRMVKTAGPTGPSAGVGAAAHQGTSWNGHSGRQPAASKKVKRTPLRPWGAPREGRSGSSRPRRQPHPDVPRAALVTAPPGNGLRQAACGRTHCDSRHSSRPGAVTGGPRGSDRHASQPALGWEPPGVQAAVPPRGVVGAAD